MKISLVIFFNTLVLSYSVTLPKSLKPCRKSDPKYQVCIDAAAGNLMKEFGHGIGSLKIPRFEPLEIENIKIGKIEGPVSLQQDYYNVKIQGLGADFRTHVEKIDLDNLLMVVKTFNPTITLIAAYQIKGRVIIIPIDGKGVANFTAVSVDARHELYFEKYKNNGETYLRVKNYILQFRPKHFHMDLQDLFAGADPEIAKNLNNLIHENSDLMFTEIRGDFEKVFADIYKSAANRVFTNFPMRVLFPE